jgi:ribosomal-protein-alanine N-acetyltransferase
VKIRPLVAADLDDILAIQSASAEASQWPGDSYTRIVAGESPTDFAWVARDEGGQVTAFLVARLVADECEILNLAVHPAHRRRGVAGALLDHNIDHARSSGITRAFLEVRRSNAAAIRFYQSHNFCSTGIRSCYYSHPKEDAILLSRILSSGSAEKLAR